jgi:hypothetical protein
MPDILAEVKGTWLDGRQTEFLQAVHRAVVYALKTPDDEPLARLLEHRTDSYLSPHIAGERFTRIEIVLFKSRSLESKRQLYRALVENLRPFGIPAEDVKIVLIEVTADDVGFRGGKAASDVDLGYSLEV